MATTLISRMMKKAASSSVIQLANRRITHRNYTSVIKTATIDLSRQVSQETTIPTYQFNSDLAEKKSYSDDTFINVIESVVDCSEQKYHEFAEASREFPFKIVDNIWERSIILSREYQGEEIKATVHEPHEPRRDDFEYDLYEEMGKKFDPQCTIIYLNVSISKKSGLTLEFSVESHAADGIKIYSMSHLRVKNLNASRDDPSYEKGPYIVELDEKLQKAFHTYLEVRGFESSISKFLSEYMVQRKNRKHTAWLNCLKNFIAN